MDDEPDRAAFRQQWLDRRAALLAASADSAGTRKAVALDPQVMGRVLRQDALQQQAMANAQEGRRQIELRKITAALARIESGDSGWCEMCGEPIARPRLEIDPTTLCCVRCVR